MTSRHMSTSSIRRALVAAGLLLLYSGIFARAEAQEQIVLPYDCNVVGGRVQVRPSGDQAYRIYGTRRQEPYRACSEQNPDRCRTFLVHRFTMACGRERAEWPDVYAAIARITDGRAFYNNDGRLYYRMGPREPRDSYPFPEPRRATGLVEMPDGYAPIAGVDAIFTPLDPRVAELEDGGTAAEPRASREARTDAPAAGERSTFAPAVAPKAAVAPQVPDNGQPAGAKAVEANSAEMQPAPLPQRPPPDQKPLETSSTSLPATVPAKPDVADGQPAAPAVPTILNNPAAKEVESASRTETVVAAAEVAPPPPAATVEGPRVEGWSTTGGTGISVPPLAFAILIAAATLATLLVILKKQAAVPVAAGPLRVPVEPVLPGLEPRLSPPSGQSLVVREEPSAPTLSKGAATAPGMPATREEALALLGLSAGASEAVIRKVVEALRQSWHPDLA
ncbi:MAG: hypothetical protein ACM3L9_05790, partial [Deltaproteobacteria bacterium]